jgi:hypothetical protein
MGVFKYGKLNNGPFICIDGIGSRKLFSMMEDGRPAEKSYMT